jgi:hypothetical protein
VIVVAGKRWQGDAMVSYHRDTEMNGVQRSEDLTSQEIFDPTPSLSRWIDANLRDWRLGGKTKLRKGLPRDFYEEREG